MTAAVDFDGTIVEPLGSKDLEHAALRNGAVEALELLQNAGMEVAVLTAAKNTEDIEEWLEEAGVPFDWVTNTKPPAVFYIDDRAVNAQQPWESIIEEAFNRFQLPAVKHTVITGYSGAGKSTLAKHLAEAAGLPVWKVDQDQLWRASIGTKDDPRRYEQGCGSYSRYRKLLKKLVRRAIRKEEPHVLEGCQFLVAPGTLRGHSIIVVDADEDTVVQQRLMRDAAVQKCPVFWRYSCPSCGGENAWNGDRKNGTHFRGGALCEDCSHRFSAVHRKPLERDVPYSEARSEKARFLYRKLEPAVQKFKELPDAMVVTPETVRKWFPVFKGPGQPCKPGETASRSGCIPTQEAASMAHKPTPGERRHAVVPQAMEWQAPPPKQKRSGKFKRPKGEKSQTAIGDRAEELIQELGFRSILPVGRRSHAAGEVAKLGSSIDVEFDHSGKAYELKVCNTNATEYRLKAKKSEKDAKMKYARKHKLKVYTLIGVREVGTGRISFYASKEPGLIGAEVNSRDFDFVGSVEA